jgi:hypothetical protein
MDVNCSAISDLVPKYQYLHNVIWRSYPRETGYRDISFMLLQIVKNSPFRKIKDRHLSDHIKKRRYALPR